jgi:hypothetical protein
VTTLLVAIDLSRYAGFAQEIKQYEGVLVLTTSKLPTINKAIQSAVSIKLFYPELEMDAREQIWRKHAKISPRSTLSDDDLIMLSEETMNGGEIERTMQTANLVADVHGVDLDFFLVRGVLIAALGRELDHLPMPDAFEDLE